MRAFPLFLVLSLLALPSLALRKINQTIKIGSRSTIFDSTFVSNFSKLLILEGDFMEQNLKEYDVSNGNLMRSFKFYGQDRFIVSQNEAWVYLNGNHRILAFSRWTGNITAFKSGFVSYKGYMAIDDSSLYYSDPSSGDVYSFDLKSGNTKWSQQISNCSQIQISGSSLWILGQNSILYQLSSKTGSLMKVMQLNSSIEKFKVVTESLLYTETSTTETLDKWDLVSGKIINATVLASRQVYLSDSYAFTYGFRAGPFRQYSLISGEIISEYSTKVDTSSISKILFANDQRVLAINGNYELMVFLVFNFTCPVAYGIDKDWRQCNRCPIDFWKNSKAHSSCQACPIAAKCVNGTFYSCKDGYSIAFTNNLQTGCAIQKTRDSESEGALVMTLIIVGAIVGFMGILHISSCFYLKCQSNLRKGKVESLDYLPKEIVIKTDDGLPNLTMLDRFMVMKFVFMNFVIQPATTALDVYNFITYFASSCLVTILKSSNSLHGTAITAFTITSISASLIWNILFILLIRKEAVQVKTFLKERKNATLFQKIWIIVERLENLHYSTGFNIYHACLILPILNDGLQYGNVFLVMMDTTGSFPLTLFIRSLYSTISLGALTSYFFMRIMIYPAFVFKCLPPQRKLNDYGVFRNLLTFVRVLFTIGLLVMPLMSFFGGREDIVAVAFTKTIESIPMTKNVTIDEMIQNSEFRKISSSYSKANISGLHIHYLTNARSFWVNSSIEILKVEVIPEGKVIMRNNVVLLAHKSILDKKQWGPIFVPLDKKIPDLSIKYTTTQELLPVSPIDEQVMIEKFNINSYPQFEEVPMIAINGDILISPTDLPSKACSTNGTRCHSVGVLKRHKCKENDYDEKYCVYSWIWVKSSWEFLCSM